MSYGESFIFDKTFRISVQEWLKKGVKRWGKLIFLFSQSKYKVYWLIWCEICSIYNQKKNLNIQYQFLHIQGIKSQRIREIHHHVYLSLPDSLHWPWPPRKKRELPPFRVALWGNLGIIVALIYPENPANPFFHLDVPELMPKPLHHRGSAAPWLCSVTCFLPFTYSALLKLLHALGFGGFKAHTWQLIIELTWFYIDNMVTSAWLVHNRCALLLVLQKAQTCWSCCYFISTAD